MSPMSGSCFIRIYEKLGFEVLKSQEAFPHYVLSRDELPIRAARRVAKQ